VARKDRIVVDLHHLDPFPDLPVMRGPKEKGVGAWQPNVKHRLLAQYIDAAWAPARRFTSWVFIDPFCGPGRIAVQGEGENTRRGGAAIAWAQSVASGTPFGKMFIGDLDQASVDACSVRLTSDGASVISFQGPAVDTVKAMVKAVPRGALALAYVDPFDLRFLDYSILETLASLKHVDFVVNFFTSDMRRNIDKAGRFDAVSPGWRTRVSADLNKQHQASELFSDWRTNVQALDFKFSKAMPMVKNSKNSEMYKLVFFARHELPNKLWKDVAGSKNLDLFAEG
jgi:three-Cys-motif partner protein